MGIFNSYRIRQRNEAKQTLGKISTANSRVLIVHYSCESFYDKSGYTPRVTCIGVLNRENNESIVFSIHLQAQILNKSIESLSSSDLNLVEKEMLSEFANFVSHHKNHIWVHWNMRSASYGFQAISNRFRILGGDIIEVPDINKVDLSQVFYKMYTNKFEEHAPNGQLLNLAERNSISMRDALPGKEEAAAFDGKNYLVLQMSTMRKVEIIDRLLSSQEIGKLKHGANMREVYDLTIPGMIGMVRESSILLILWTILVFIIGAALEPLIQKYLSPV